jgi:sodium/potassium/calcium exchanger 6
MHPKFPSLERLVDDWMLCLQLLLGPQVCVFVLMSQGMDNAGGLYLFITSSVVLLASGLLIWWVLSSQPVDEPPRDSLPISILAFAVSLTWIYLSATSAVSLLMTLALILNIPTALLGATVFAVGQSSNDLVANTAVARRGMPVLAAGATFGGPMMNMFMGIGGGGLVQVLKSEAAGGSGIYTFKPAAGLFVSAAGLLLGLVVTLSYVFWNSWQLDRRLGFVLIGIWVSFTAVSVAVSMTP